MGGQYRTEEEIQSIINEFDTDGSKVIYLPEFLSCCDRMIANSREEMIEQWIEMFRFRDFDRAGTGFISAAEMRDLMLHLPNGEKLTEADLDEMVREADIDGDGQINYEEFVKRMIST